MRRWIRVWLSLLPFDARRDYGAEMEQVFVAQHRDAARDGRGAVSRLWAETAAGILRTAPREQWAVTAADVRVAGRVWRNAPWLLTLLVSTLALGIAGFTVAFSVVHGVLLRPLGVGAPQSLLRLAEVHASAPAYTNLTYATFLDLEPGGQSFERVAASRGWFANLTGNGTPERLAGALVSGGFFDTLAIQPRRGRLLSTADDEPGRDNVVVVSEGLWRRRFGSDEGIVGRRLQLNGTAMEVVGVVPAGAEMPLGADIWTPLVARGTGLQSNRQAHLLEVLARPRRGATLEAVQAELRVRASQIVDVNPGADDELDLTAAPAIDPIVASARGPLLAILAGAIVLLLVLCANVAHVLLARASARGREMALRVALGASRGRVARLLLTESAALTAVSAIVGLAAAAAVVNALPAFLPGDLPRADDIGLDWRVVGVAIVCVAFMAGGVGLVPALRASRVATAAGRAHLGVERRRWPVVGHLAHGSGLAAAQVAITFVLLVAAALIVQSAVAVARLPLGFGADRLLRVELSMSAQRLPANADGDAWTGVVAPLVEAVARVPGVVTVGLTNTAPLGDGAVTAYVVNGRPAGAEREPSADIRIVDASFFSTLGVPLRAGRLFTARDSARARTVMVISEALARREFPGESPIGRAITMLHWGPPLTAEVVGVVGDVVGQQLEADVAPTIYWHYPQFPQLGSVSLVARTRADPASLASDVRRAIWAVDPNQPIARVEPYHVWVREARARRMLLTWVLGAFAGAAVLFALLGVYGVVAFQAARDTRAFGVRLALGARPLDIAGLVVRDAAAIALAGIAVGGIAAIGGASALDSLLFRVHAADPRLFGVVAVALATAAIGAAAGPALRAGRVDPAVSLGAE